MNVEAEYSIQNDKERLTHFFVNLRFSKTYQSHISIFISFKTKHFVANLFSISEKEQRVKR